MSNIGRIFAEQMRPGRPVVALCAAVCFFASCNNKPTEKPASIAEEEIRTLALALESYEIRQGRLPSSSQKNGYVENRLVISELMQAELRTGNEGWSNQASLHLPLGRLVGQEFVDPWGNAYVFAFSTNVQTGINLGWTNLSMKYAIWSCGPNGVDERGAGDDIANWRN